TTNIYTLSLHDALPIYEDQKERSRYIGLFLVEGKAESVLSEDDHRRLRRMLGSAMPPSIVEHFVRSLSKPGRLTAGLNYYRANRSEEHTSELQSPDHLV